MLKMGAIRQASELRDTMINFVEFEEIKAQYGFHYQLKRAKAELGNSSNEDFEKGNNAEEENKDDSDNQREETSDNQREETSDNQSHEASATEIASRGYFSTGHVNTTAELTSEYNMTTENFKLQSRRGRRTRQPKRRRHEDITARRLFVKLTVQPKGLTNSDRINDLDVPDFSNIRELSGTIDKPLHIMDGEFTADDQLNCTLCESDQADHTCLHTFRGLHKMYTHPPTSPLL